MNKNPFDAIDDFVLSVTGSSGYMGKLLAKIIIVLGIILVVYAIFNI